MYSRTVAALASCGAGSRRSRHNSCLHTYPTTVGQPGLMLLLARSHDKIERTKQITTHPKNLEQTGAHKAASQPAGSKKGPAAKLPFHRQRVLCTIPDFTYVHNVVWEHQNVSTDGFARHKVRVLLASCHQCHRLLQTHRMLIHQERLEGGPVWF